MRSRIIPSPLGKVAAQRPAVSPPKASPCQGEAVARRRLMRFVPPKSDAAMRRFFASLRENNKRGAMGVVLCKVGALRRAGRGTLGLCPNPAGAAAAACGRMMSGAVRHMIHILRMHDAERLQRSMRRVPWTHEERKNESSQDTVNSRSLISKATSSGAADIIAH